MVYFNHCCPLHWISIQILMKFGPSDHKSTLARVMAWRLAISWTYADTYMRLRGGGGGGGGGGGMSFKHISKCRMTCAPFCFAIMHMIRHVYQFWGPQTLLGFSLLSRHKSMFLLGMFSELLLYVTNENCYLYGNKFDLTWLDLTWHLQIGAHG